MDKRVGCEYDVLPIASSSKREERRVKQGRTQNLTNLAGIPERWVIDEDDDGGESLDDIGKGYQDLNPRNVDENELRRFGRMPERRLRSHDEMQGLSEDQRRHIEHKRYSASIDPVRGSSSNYSESSYSQGEQFRNGYRGHRFDNLDNSGDNRIELLRKIGELKDQLSRSSMADQDMEKNHHYKGNVHYHHDNRLEDWISSSSSENHRPFMQRQYPDHPPAPTSYINQYPESSAYRNMYAIGGSHFRRIDKDADNPIELDSLRLKTLQNDHHYNAPDDRFSERATSTNGQFSQHPFPDPSPASASFMNHYAESSGQIYMHPMDRRPVDIADSRIGKIPDHLRILHDGHYKASENSLSVTTSGKHTPITQYPFPDRHPVAASYTNRYGEPSAYMSMHAAGTSHNFHPPQNIGSRVQVFGNLDQRFLDIQYNSLTALSNHYENIGSPVLHYSRNATSMPQVQSENLQFHARWASELDTEATSLSSHQRPRLQPKIGTQHYCPIGRGAPFITCKNCFESLQLPKRAMAEDGARKKMRCGSCSSIIVVDISNNNFLVSIYEAKERTPVSGNDDIKLIEGNPQIQGHTNRKTMTLSSEDYDHSGYDFQSMDRESMPRMTNQQVSAESVRTESIHCTSSNTAEVATPDPLSASRTSSSPIESEMKVKPPPPPKGSSLQEYFEYSNKYHRGNQLKKVTRSVDQKTVMPNITASRKKFIADASDATEMEISSNGFGNTESSLDSGVTRAACDQIRVNNAAEAFSGGNGNENFRDSQESNLQEEYHEDNVTINGHLIPHQLIKKAEKVAGTIQPGNYWYDSRAGFWGVIGGPCLGIIPPSIEEFKYQMPENCAGGTTSVYVNGRELHQKDLKLLVSRGLPNDKNRYYNIRLSGKVVDEMTGEKLASLGNLAPTVSRVKHGFGMKVPKQQHES